MKGKNTREMAQQLRAIAGVLENSGLFPISHMVVQDDT